MTRTDFLEINAKMHARADNGNNAWINAGIYQKLFSREEHKQIEYAKRN